MKAAIFHGPDRPLEVCEVETPAPGPGQVLIRVAGCGLCHTDLHYIDHGVPTFKSPPLILGHEVSGTVAELGEGVRGLKPGKRILIPAVLSCGVCSYCRRGRENLCGELAMLGNHIDGGYAEFVVAPASELVEVPESLDLEKASVIADAISTPYHAVKNRGRVQVGDDIAVVGCGGVGLNVVQCAAAAGGRVIAIDVNEERLEIARGLGAAEVVDPGEVGRVDKYVRELTEGGVDVAFEAIGTPATIELGYGLLRRGGRLCVIGFSHEPVSISAAKLMFHELELVGSLGCGRAHYPEIIGLVQSGKLRLEPIVSGTVPLDQVNAALDMMRRGEGVRWVITP